jgi:hypothetical protein
MASDYTAIKHDNIERYGTDIGRIGPMLLADRYDDRTHFIYELLQNAEDARGKRDGWRGPRAVAFELSSAALRVSHVGTPFTEANVRGICGIAESTKDLTSIGCFGIGFKSVYAFTDCPEIHSGDEYFAIDSFVWPRGIQPRDTKSEETVLILPIPPNDVSTCDDIAIDLPRFSTSKGLQLSMASNRLRATWTPQRPKSHPIHLRGATRANDFFPAASRDARRPSAATRVVPLPKKASNTRPPSGHKASIRRPTNSIGF